MFLKSGPWELVTKAQQAVLDLPVFFYSWEYDSDDHIFDWIFSATPDIPVEGGEGGRRKMDRDKEEKDRERVWEKEMGKEEEEERGRLRVWGRDE